MLAADLVLLTTSVAMAHSKAAHEVRKNKGKILWMEEITPEMLRGGAVAADYEAIDALGEKLVALWNAGRSVRITSSIGTDLRVSVEGRSGYCLSATIHRRPDRFMTSSAFPDGEAGIAPVEGTGNGVVVFDGTVHGIGIPQDPIRVAVEDGIATSIDGGYEAEMLAQVIREEGDEASYNFPAEISIGLNPNCRLTGIMREDKKAYGTVHIAFGTNEDFGGSTRAKLHIDGIVLKPTLLIDDQVIVKDGRIAV
jgi:leucyl aminopeptidase (aminopeptidase T)